MKTFSTERKTEVMEWAKAHREQDQYLKGEYGRMNGSFKGCSVGCLIYDINQREGTNHEYADHAALAEYMGWPEWVCHLQDAIFENLPDPLHIDWTERLVSAIPAGKDISLALPKFLIKTLDRLPDTDQRDVVESIAAVREVLVDWSDTGTVDVDAASAAESAAWSAASAAESAAWSAESAARSAASAAWSAESAGSAASAAESAAWEAIANDLINSLESA